MLRGILAHSAIPKALKTQLMAVEQQLTKESVAKVLQPPKLPQRKKPASTDWISGKNSGKAVLVTEKEALDIAKKQAEEKEAKKQKKKRKTASKSSKNGESQTPAQNKRKKANSTQSDDTADSSAATRPPAKKRPKKAPKSNVPTTNLQEPISSSSPAASTPTANVVLAQIGGNQVWLLQNP